MIYSTVSLLFLPFKRKVYTEKQVKQKCFGNVRALNFAAR